VFLGALLITAGLCQDAAARESEEGRCSEAIVESVGEFFHLEGFSYPEKGYYPSVENGGLIVAGVCKPMPDDPSRVIAAFAYDTEVEDEKRLLLAVYDDTRQRVISSYSYTITEDATTKVSPYSIKIDTGRYVLAENVRAFGLRLNISRGQHCGADWISEDELTLYVMEERKLRPVFDAVMRKDRQSRIEYEGMDVGAKDRCGFNTYVETEKFISIEKTATHGFSDLRLTVRVIGESNKLKPLSMIVRYNGERYDYESWSNVLDTRLGEEIDKLLQEMQEVVERKE
jgi:hypothetical protein